MTLTAAVHIDPAVIQVANEALAEARRTFLKGIKFDVEPTSDFDTSVFANFESNQSTLFINYGSIMVERIQRSTIDLKMAWLLVLAHESGHQKLNAICYSNGESPAEPMHSLEP